MTSSVSPALTALSVIQYFLDDISVLSRVLQADRFLAMLLT